MHPFKNIIPSTKSLVDEIHDPSGYREIRSHEEAPVKIMFLIERT